MNVVTRQVKLSLTFINARLNFLPKWNPLFNLKKKWMKKLHVRLWKILVSHRPLSYRDRNGRL